MASSAMRMCRTAISHTIKVRFTALLERIEDLAPNMRGTWTFTKGKTTFCATNERGTENQRDRDF